MPRHRARTKRTDHEPQTPDRLISYRHSTSSSSSRLSIHYVECTPNEMRPAKFGSAAKRLYLSPKMLRALITNSAPLNGPLKRKSFLGAEVRCSVNRMKYGYARVSSDGQSVEAQVRTLREAGCAQVFREVASGAQTDRSNLRRVLNRLAAGDVLVVKRLDRLARSTRDL